MRTRHALSSLAVLALLAAPLAAHDFWVRPASLRVDVGQSVPVRLLVGHSGEAEAVPRAEERVEKFVVVGPDGQERDVAGYDGSDPAGVFTPTEAGYHVVGYRSTPSVSDLPAEKFEAYLREEGLERISELRAERGETGEAGVELYSRCAKAIVAVGDDLDGGGHDRALGFRLELVPEADPRQAGDGAAFPVRLVFEGEAIEGALVEAARLDEPEAEVVSGRTDAEGRASLPLEGAGPWLVTAVHMVEAPANDERGAKWESLWASLVFAAP